jgi:selenocysteine lyase/cysteine desulfurase
MSYQWEEMRKREWPVLDTDLVFLDAACVSLIPQRSRKRLYEFVDYCAKNDERNSSVHHITMDHMRHKAYSEAAKLLHTSEDQIALVESTSHALNIAANAIDLGPGDNILTPNLEFIQVALPWCAMRKEKGFDIKVVTAPDNAFTVKDFEKVADSHTKAIVLSSVEWCNGWRMPLKEIGDWCKSKGICLFVDSVQEMGVRDIDLSQIHVDILTAGGHKWLNSPLGTGVMYMDKEFMAKAKQVYYGYLNVVCPAADWGSYWEKPDSQAVSDWNFLQSARRFEIGGTCNYPGAISLGESLGLVNEIGIHNIEEHVLDLGDYCMQRIEDIGGTVITHKERDRRAGIVIFRLYKDTAKDLTLLRELHKQRIMIAQRFTDNVGGFRVSCQYYNLEKDIDRLFDALKPLVAKNGVPDYGK